MISDVYKVIIRAYKIPPGEHERRFNSSQINENTSREIIVQRRLQRIAERRRSFDSVKYPLIFLHREDRYVKKIQPESGIQTNKKVTSKTFYAYRL